MDLGISGRRAIVCASSKGLGRACATALGEAGCELFVNGRNRDELRRASTEMRAAAGAKVLEIVGDLNDPATRAALLEACPEADILVNNNGGPPFKAFEAVSRQDILAGVEANMLTPIALAQAVLPGMVSRKFGRIINITSSSVRAPIPGLDVSSGARAGLTAFLAAAARAHVRDNVTINSIQPGTFATDRIRRRSSGRRPSAACRSKRRGRRLKKGAPPAGSAIPWSWARCAPSSRAPEPATSPARTSSSTGARFPARFDGRRKPVVRQD